MTEQRQEDRQDLEGTICVMDLESGVEFSAEGRNLSSHGLLFHADMEPPVGADMQISLSGTRKNIRVVRVQPQERGGFDVASRITR
jgi:hypothetical protein